MLRGWHIVVRFFYKKMIMLWADTDGAWQSDDFR